MGFMDFLSAGGNAQILHFWLMASSFSKELKKAQTEQARGTGTATKAADEANRDAAAIFQRFLDKDAPEPVKIDEKTRKLVASNMTGKAGPSPGCFDSASHLAYAAMRGHFFPAYVQSEMYKKMLDKVVGAAGAEHVRRGLGDHASGKHSAASARYATPTKQVSALDGATSEEPALPRPRGSELLGEDAEAADQHFVRLFRRRGSFGSVDEWGNHHRDIEAINPLFNPVEGKEKKKAKDQAAHDAALTKAQAIIADVYDQLEKGKRMEPCIRRASSNHIIFEPSVETVLK